MIEIFHAQDQKGYSAGKIRLNIKPFPAAFLTFRPT